MYSYHLHALKKSPQEVLNWSTATPFHTEQWARLINQVFGIPTQHLGVTDGDTLVAYLPYRYGGVFGKNIRSGPVIANYSPNIIFNEKLRRESAIVHQLLARLYGDATINSSSSATSSTSIFNLNISGSFEDYWHSSVHAKAKYDVRKADKHHIETRFFGVEACGTFYSLYLKRMQELGSPALPLIFFESLAKFFEEDFSFAVSFKDGLPVAASTLMSVENRWIGHPWSVSDSAFRDLSVNYAHYRDLIKHAFEGGYTQFYLGPSLKNSNWSRIKLRFGGEESFAVRLDGRANHHPSESAMVQTAQTLLRKLPAPIFKRTSPLLTRLALRLLA